MLQTVPLSKYIPARLRTFPMQDLHLSEFSCMFATLSAYTSPLRSSVTFDATNIEHANDCDAAATGFNRPLPCRSRIAKHIDFNFDWRPLGLQ